MRGLQYLVMPFNVAERETLSWELKSELKMKIFYVIPILLILTACDSHEESVCKKEIEDSILNPESLEIKEFNKISFEEFAILKGWSKQRIEDLKKKDPNYEYNPMFYTRFQSKGKLGNDITTVSTCIYFSTGYAYGGGEYCGCGEVE